jgi:hypothetical protein
LAAAAMTALGWAPAVRVEVALFGARMLIGADPDLAEITRRQHEDLPPAADAWRLRSRLDDDPSFGSRPPPVRLVGAIAARSSWAAARSVAGLFTAFAPRAVLVPALACPAGALIEAAVTGMGVVVYDEGGVRLLAAAAGPVRVRRSHVHRLVEERVWSAVTAAGPVTAVPGSVLPGSVLPGSVLPGSVLPGSVVQAAAVSV